MQNKTADHQTSIKIKQKFPKKIVGCPVILVRNLYLHMNEVILIEEASR